MEYDYQTYEFDFDKKFISKSSFISLLEYLKEASKKNRSKKGLYSHGKGEVRGRYRLLYRPCEKLSES